MIAVRPEPDAQWIEHFYVAPEQQGKGLGGAVLRQAMDRSRDHRPFRLNVFQGSAARQLYERHGFAVESEDAVDVFMAALCHGAVPGRACLAPAPKLPVTPASERTGAASPRFARSVVPAYSVG